MKNRQFLQYTQNTYSRFLSRCRKNNCKFYSINTDSCDYILATGKPRSRICPAGENCILFAEKPTEEKRRNIF